MDTEGFWRPGWGWELAPRPLGVSDWQALKALISLAIGGLGFWGGAPAANVFREHLGVYGTHFWIAITPFSTRRVRQASPKGALPSCWGSGDESQPSTFSGAFGCEWNPFLNSVNTILTLFSLGLHINSAFWWFTTGRGRQWYWRLPPDTHREHIGHVP